MIRPAYFFLRAVFIISISYSCYANEKVVLSTYEYPPEQSESLPHYGVVLHIIEEAFLKEGIAVEWKWYPHKRAIAMAERGKVDGIATMGYAKERTKFMIPSDTVISAITRFYHLKSFHFDWQDMSDLKNIPGNVGITPAYNYGDEFNTAIKNNIFKTDPAINDVMNLKKLLAGRIKIFPMTTGIAEHLIITELKPGDISKITYHPKPVRSFDSYLYFTKAQDRGKKFLDIFNKGLRNLKDSGRYNELITAYERGEYSKAQ